MTFTAGRITASAGCNTMTGGWQADGDTLVVGDLATTLMAGPDDVMRQERWLAQFLAARPTISRDGPALVLSAPDARLVLRPAADSGDAPLAGTMWRVVSIEDAAGRSRVEADLLVRVRADLLLAESTLSVQTGCNLGQARVLRQDGDVVELGPLRLTRRACPPGAGPVEAAMVAVLHDTVRATVAGETLRVSRSGDDRVLVCRRERPGSTAPPGGGVKV